MLILGGVFLTGTAGILSARPPPPIKAPTNTWEIIGQIRTSAQPLLDHGKYREAASLYYKRMITIRDRKSKAFIGHEIEWLKLRHATAAGRPGEIRLELDFDHPGLPDGVQFDPVPINIETQLAVSGSAGALRVSATPGGNHFMQTEIRLPAGLTVEPDTLIGLYVFAHHAGEIKIQLNTAQGSVHYYLRQHYPQDKWFPFFLQVSADGDRPVQVGEKIHGICFVGTAQEADAYAVLDGWRVVAHPYQ